jgi:two-component system OmpR family response regulator
MRQRAASELKCLEMKYPRPTPPHQPAGDVIRVADWMFDVTSPQLGSTAGPIVRLTPIEHRILVLLVRNPRAVITRDELADAATGRRWQPFDRSIDVHIANLRRKIDLDPNQPSLIRTVRGAGYMFIPPREPAPG